MTREVYSDSDFIEFSRSQIFARLFVDSDPDNAELAREFGIEGVPTLIILDSKGKEVDRIEGSMAAPALIETLKFIFEAAKEGSISL